MENKSGSFAALMMTTFLIVPTLRVGTIKPINDNVFH